MKVTKKHKQILEAIELIKQDGQQSCTRKDILSLIGEEDKAINFSLIFKEIESSGELIKADIKDGRNIQYILTDEMDTYEDLDGIFDSLLEAVDVINVRVNQFQELKEDKDFKIKQLESDVLFYRGKVVEYKEKVTRLQQKVDSMRWG